MLQLLLHVFIGNRMYQLADPEERHKLDATGKVLNGLSIAFGVAVGSGVGIYVWRLMMKCMPPLSKWTLFESSHACADVNAVELRDEHLEQGLLSGRTSSEHARHSFDYQRTLSMDRRNQDVDAEEMSLDEIDRELRAQGVDHRATTADETHPGSPSAGWGDHFSDFEDQEDEPLPKDPQATQDVARTWDESQPAKKGQDSSLL